MDMCKWFFAVVLALQWGLEGQKCGKGIFFQLSLRKCQKKLAEIEVLEYNECVEVLFFFLFRRVVFG
jgi:hypothetical protein